MANTKITNPELFNLGDSTSATQLPVMTTTQRIAMNAPITTPFNIDYLVVAGGGGGGPGYQAGGGGAGGMRTSFGTGNINGGLTAVENSLTLATGTSYTVYVGAAGAAGAGSFPSANRGGTGGNSEINGTGITTITSQGGGGGASYNNYNQGGLNLQGSPGGSGGGSAPHGSQPTATGGVRVTNPIQGFDGGDSLSYTTPYYGAGGGGAGGAGGVSNGANTGLGGLGLESAITVASGSGPYYAGGGGGGSYFSTGGAPGVGGSGVGGNGGTTSPSLNAAGAGATNTGSGGGGGSNNGNVGGAGGSGVVILRYATADIASYTATGLTPTETTVGTDTILSFTTVGTGAITFTSSTPTGTISTGEMIFNSTTDKVEYWDGTKWYGITYEIIYPASLKMYLDASNTTSYPPPQTGSTWFDLTSNANNGTISGATWNPGGYFDVTGASNSGINIAGLTTQITPNGNDSTMGGWFKKDNTNWGTFWSKGAGSQYELQMAGGTGSGTAYPLRYIFYRRSGSAVGTALSTTYLSANTWYHIIGVIDWSNQAIKLYLNGSLIATNTSWSHNTSNQLLTGSIYLGRRNDNSGNLDGKVAAFRVYDEVLTASEITALFDENKSDYGY